MVKKMKKINFACLVLAVFAFAFIGCDKKTQTEKDVAEMRTKEYRSVNVINNTSEKLIAECNLTTKNGTLIDHKNKQETENITFKDFDKKHAFENEKEFKVILINRFGLKYEKDFIAKNTGTTDVVIDESCYVKQLGDWKKNVEKLLDKIN